MFPNSITVLIYLFLSYKVFSITLSQLERVWGWEKWEKRPNEIKEGEVHNSALDKLSDSQRRLEMSHQMEAGVLDPACFHLHVSFRLLTSQWGPGEPGAGREELQHHPPSQLLQSSGVGVRCHKQSLSVCACAANMHQPNGGIFSHLRSSASQMAAMLMNPTGCCDTTASGRSKWGFGVKQVCVQTCVFRRRASVCVDVSFQSKIGMRCPCSEVHQGGPTERQQHLTLKKKVGKQHATLTQETGAIGDCLHCYPINRP